MPGGLVWTDTEHAAAGSPDRMPDPETHKPPIFVGGCGRSGTTLVRVILDSHPNIACGPEIKVTAPVMSLWAQCRSVFAETLQSYHLQAEDINDAFADLIRTLLDKYRAAAGKSRIAEKTPGNLFFFQHLHQLFPQSPLIHVIRDGRDVVTSLLAMNWVDAKTGQPVPYTQDARKAAEYWVRAIRTGRELRAQPGMDRCYMDMRYEDMVREPERTLRELFAFIDEPWDPVVLAFHEQQRDLASESSAEQVARPLYTQAAGRWQSDLAEADRAAVKQVAGETLVELGYAADLNW